MKAANVLFMDFFKSASLPDDLQTPNIQIVSSVFARESPLSASLQAIITPFPSSLRAHKLTSLYGEIASKFSDKKAKVEAAATALSTSHPTKPSKATSSLPSISQISTTSTPKTTVISTAMGGIPLNHTASGGTNNSTTSAPIVISTTSTDASGSATKDAAVASSALTPSSTPNMGTVQPTGVLKAAGALAVGVAGMMILL